MIHRLDNPVSKEATAILYGNLAPNGAVMKPSAADPRFLKHKGPALVFESYDEMAAVIDSDDLDVTPDHVLVLKNAGPVGAGMPEWGMMPIPKKLLTQGVRDMLRMSDARMSGTSYGACILHVSPGGRGGRPVRAGAHRRHDRARRRRRASSTWPSSEDELARRKAEWRPKPLPPRGYGRMFAAHIQQAHEGCDFDFLLGTEPLPEPEIH